MIFHFCHLCTRLQDCIWTHPVFSHGFRKLQLGVLTMLLPTKASSKPIDLFFFFFLKHWLAFSLQESWNFLGRKMSSSFYGIHTLIFYPFHYCLGRLWFIVKENLKAHIKQLFLLLVALSSLGMRAFESCFIMFICCLLEAWSFL